MGLSNLRVLGCTRISEVVWTSTSSDPRKSIGRRANGVYNSDMARSNHNPGLRRRDRHTSPEEPEIPAPRQKEYPDRSGRCVNPNRRYVGAVQDLPRVRPVHRESNVLHTKQRESWCGYHLMHRGGYPHLLRHHSRTVITKCQDQQG
jgi:hypothetical protein